jgi:hypothetical protein
MGLPFQFLVCSPLNGADVNTFLMHFPQGAELTKLIDVVLDG